MFYTADEIKSLRTLGLRPGIKLLGFKDSTELRIEDNVKHSIFIFPNEQVRSFATHEENINISMCKGIFRKQAHVQRFTEVVVEEK